MKKCFFLLCALLAATDFSVATLFSVDSATIQRVKRDSDSLWICFKGDWTIGCPSGVWRSSYPDNYICIERPEFLPSSDWTALCDTTTKLIGKNCSIITDCGFLMVRGNIPVRYGAERYFAISELKPLSCDFSTGYPLQCSFDLRLK